MLPGLADLRENPTLGSLPSWYFQSIIMCLPPKLDPADRYCRNHICPERKYFQKNPAEFKWYSSSGIFRITILHLFHLSTAEKDPLSWKAITVTWSTPTLTPESDETSTNRETSASFAEEPWTWQPRRPGGSQGLAAAATGWLSGEGQRQRGRGTRLLPAPAGTATEKAGGSQGALPPFKGHSDASSGSSAARANLSVGGGIAQRKLGEISKSQKTVISVKREGWAAPAQRDWRLLKILQKRDSSQSWSYELTNYWCILDAWYN